MSEEHIGSADAARKIFKTVTDPVSSSHLMALWEGAKVK